MKKFQAFLAAACCTMALSATTYNCHLKVVVNGYATEQDQVKVEVTENNGTYDLSLKNFALIAGDQTIPVGNIEANGVPGVNEYGYTTIIYNENVTITEGDDPQYSYWMGPMLGDVPVRLTSRFIDTALSATIDIELGDMIIAVNVFGVAPAESVLDGDVNKDGEVNIADVNSVIDIILNN